MDNLKTLTRKSLMSAVVFVTVFSTLGLGALIPAGSVSAATADDVDRGDDIKKIGVSSVFHITNEDKKAGYSFGYAYQSYRSDFSGVLELPADTDFTQWPTDARIINPQAGCALLTTEFTPNIYAILPGNKVQKIADLDAMEQLYPEWKTMVYDYPEIYFAQFDDVTADMGALTTDDMVHAGQYFTVDGVTYWLDMDGTAYEIDGPESILCAVPELSELPDEVQQVADTSKTFAEIADPVAAFGQTTEPGTGNEVTGGDLTFGLSSNTPDSTTVPQSATQVPYLTFTVKGGSEGATVNDITFERYGLGDENNFDKVWLEVDGVPVSNEQSVNSDDTVLLSPNYAVGANETVEFTLIANLPSGTTYADTSSEDGFRIKSASMVDATGDVMGSFPISGNKMVYSSFAIGTATIDDRGTATDVEVGSNQQVIGEFDIDWSSNNESTAQFKSIRLKVDGTSNISDFDNFALFEDDGTEVSSDVSMWGDYVTFKVKSNSQNIEDGKTRHFEVRADIVNGDDGDTVYMNLDNSRDLKILDLGANDFGAQITDSMNGSNSSETGTMKTYTFDAGQFTVSKSSDNPSNEEYAVNTSDVTALVANVDAGQAITVDGLKVYLHSDSTINVGTDDGTDADNINADIERAKLYVNDKKISTQTSVTAGSGTHTDNAVATDEYYYDFDTNFTVKDNDVIKLVIDIENDPSTNTYKFTFDINDFTSPEYVSTGESVPSGNKSGSVTGNDVAITDASLSITRNDGFPSTQSYVAGASDAKFFCFLVDVGSASDVELRTINFDTNLASSYLSSNYTKFTNFYLKDMDSDTVITDLEDMNSSGSFTFSSVNKTVAKSDQMNVCLFGNIGVGAAASTSVQFTLDGSDSTFNDQEGDAISYSADDSSQTLAFTSTGVLKVTVDADTPDAAIVAANQTVDLASWYFEAEDDDIYIKDFYVANNTTTGSNTAEDDYDSRVASYQLYVDGSLVATKVPVSGKAHFDLSGSDRVFVEKDGHTTVTIKAKLNAITDETQTHSLFKLALYALEAESAGPGTDLGIQTTTSGGGVTTTNSSEVIAVTDSTTNLDTAPTGNLIAAYKSIPTLSSSDSNGVALLGASPEFSNGQTDIFKFKVKADSKGSISWGQVTLHVTGACNGGALLGCIAPAGASDWTLTDSANNQITISAVSTSTANKIELELTTPDTVGAGSTETYILNANLDSFAAGDSIKISLKDGTSAHVDARTLANAKTGAGATGAFVWTDNSAGGQGNTSETQWFIGRDVPGLDTVIQSWKWSS